MPGYAVSWRALSWRLSPSPTGILTHSVSACPKLSFWPATYRNTLDVTQRLRTSLVGRRRFMDSFAAQGSISRTVPNVLPVTLSCKVSGTPLPTVSLAASLLF